MKLRLLVGALAVASLALAGCGDDITNIIEDIATPTSGTPPTQAPPTNTPTEGVVVDTPTPTATMGEETPEATPTVCEGEGCATCGNGVTEDPETCDDGGICFDNPGTSCTSPDDCGGGRCVTVGGDGCAANCTEETEDHRISADFAEGSGSTVQTIGTPFVISLTGTQTVQAGDIRDDTVVDVNGDEIFAPGDIPIIVKADDVQIDPVVVTGLVCACVRGIEVPFFGPGNSATGRVACGETGGPGFDYLLAQDHNTDPGGANRNPDCALDLDPECDDQFVFPSGVVSDACREQIGAECLDPAMQPHMGICNSPRVIEFSDNDAPRGSAIINNNTAIGLLSDGGRCDLTIGGMSPCPQASYGPDCIPCTDDDADLGVPENIPTTTGIARAVIYNANTVMGRSIAQGSGVPCTVPGAGEPNPCADEGAGLCSSPERCYADLDDQGAPLPTGTCQANCGRSGCVTESVGEPFDCDKLLNTPQDGLAGGALAVSFPSIDANLILDNTTTTRFVFE